jgi:hypothetical protein
MWSTAHWGPWDTWQHRSSRLTKAEPRAVGHMSTPELPPQEGRALGYVAAPELKSARRRGPRQQDTWRRRSPPQQGGEVRGHGTRGGAGAHLSKVARSRAAEHMAVPETTSAGSCDPKLQHTWQCMDARSTPCLDLELVCKGSRSLGCRQRPPNPHREML